MPETKTRSPSFTPVGEEGKIVVGVEWFVVLVDSEERDVEVVARVGEVIWVAAEEGCVEFRRHHEPNIAIDLVLVEVIHAT